MSKTVTAIRHLAFEDLGAFETVLSEAGYRTGYIDIGLDDPDELDPIQPDLLIVLGGPIGAYEEDRYPFLTREIRLIEERLKADRPVLGICLGAQLMARALGASVYPGPASEIGFKPLTLIAEGQGGALSAFAGNPVLHWHGDTFDLPPGAIRLASTDICANQAFSFGRNALATQFHPEAGGPAFERWLIGHAVELAGAGVDVPALRMENERLSAGLCAGARQFLEGWLAGLERA